MYVYHPHADVCESGVGKQASKDFKQTEHPSHTKNPAYNRTKYTAHEKKIQRKMHKKKGS